MKLLLSAFLLFISMSAFTSVTPTGCDDEMILYREVISLVNDKQAVKELEFKELAEVTFTVGEDNAIHVVQVITKDELFAFHIRQKLEGVIVDHCFMQDQPYTVLINAKIV